MAPKKKVERGAQENISLGPQVREGEHYSECLWAHEQETAILKMHKIY
jgi:hypothetical protein